MIVMLCWGDRVRLAGAAGRCWLYCPARLTLPYPRLDVCMQFVCMCTQEHMLGATSRCALLATLCLCLTS